MFNRSAWIRGLLSSHLCLSAFAIAAESTTGTGAESPREQPIIKEVAHYGYCFSLGMGDFIPSSPLRAQCWKLGFKPPTLPDERIMVREWTLPVWKQRLAKLRGIGVKTLFVQLNGNYLPYPSAKYPALVEKISDKKLHPNVQAEFFGEVMSSARELGIEMVAVLTTTGNALGFAMANPELAIRDRTGKPAPHGGNLCPRQAKARQYVKDVVGEVLTRYQVFWGVMVRPPDLTQPCFCDACKRDFKTATGKEMDQAAEADLARSVLDRHLAFEKAVLNPEIARLAPQARRLMVTIPSVFERDFEPLAPGLDPKTILVDIDYDLSDEAIAKLPARLDRYRKFGHEVWLMPSAGGPNVQLDAYGGTRDQHFKFRVGRAMNKLKYESEMNPIRQVEVAYQAGLRGFVYSVGPCWTKSIHDTSWFMHQLKSWYRGQAKAAGNKPVLDQGAPIIKEVGRYGYHLFLGRGDFVEGQLASECWKRGYKLPRIGPSEPDHVFTWDLPTWKRRIDKYRDIGVNTLAILLNGHFLPYPSQKYPHLVEKDHPNVKAEFFGEVIKYAREQGIDIVIQLTTTGHALGMTTTCPEVGLCGRSGQPNVYDGNMCFRKEKARQYVQDVVTEILTRYQGIWGVIVHPPELTAACCCAECKADFKAKTGKELEQATPDETTNYTLERYLDYERKVLDPLLARLAPNARRLQHTVPHIYAKCFEQLAPNINPKTVIVEWQYETGAGYARIPPRLARFRQFGHEVWFQGTAGYPFGVVNEENLFKQLNLIYEGGTRDFMFFHGPFFWSATEDTSWFLQQLKDWYWKRENRK